MTATADLLAFAAAPHVVPLGMRTAALRLLTDTLAVGCAGASAPGAHGVLAAALGWGGGTVVPVLGRRVRLPEASAAFVNAFQIHALEWDAVHERAVVHAMSVVVAALHASAHAHGADPEDALAALCVGVDVAAGLGLAATSPLRFFRPATAGLIGAALAVARLRGLPAAAFADVLGLAYSACAGTMQAHVEGSVALPLQVAGAARAAITAVDLVAHGLTGPHDALEGPFGYFRLFDDGDLSAYTHALGTWRIAELSIKPYPSGRASHATLGQLDAWRRGGLAAADVATMTLRAPPLVRRLVDRPWQSDMTPSYARLCLPFLAALMLTDGRIDPRRFVPATFADPALRALGDRLTIAEDGTSDPNALFPQQLTVLTNDRVFDTDIADALGTPANPLDAAAWHAKLDLALALALVPPPRDDLIARPLDWLTGAAP